MLRLVIISTLLVSLGFSQNEEIKIAKVEVEGNEVTSKKIDAAYKKMMKFKKNKRNGTQKIKKVSKKFKERT